MATEVDSQGSGFGSELFKEVMNVLGEIITDTVFK